MVEVLTWSELVARAGTPGRARTLVRSGLYQAVLRGTYVLGAEDPSAPEVRAAALRRFLPPDVALSHRAALWVLGEDVLDRGVLDVVVPRGRHLERQPGLRVHAAALPDEHLVLVDGLLVVSAARAVVDVARTEVLATAVAFGDRALRTGAADEAGIGRALAWSAGLRGVRRARLALGLLDGRSESWMESLLRVSLLRGGLTGLRVQHDVWTARHHVGRADLYVEGVFVEFDGRTVRLQRSLFTPERRRQTRVSESGHELRRFTSDDVLDRSPGDLVAEVRRAEVLARGHDRSLVVPGRDTLRPPRLRPLPTLADGARAA